MPLHNYCTALGFGTQNQCVRCVRVTISSLGRYVAVLVFLRKAQSLSQAGELDSSMSRRDFYWRYRQRKRRLELRYYEPSCTFDNDGKETTFRFAGNREAPAIYLTSPRGAPQTEPQGNN